MLKCIPAVNTVTTAHTATTKPNKLFTRIQDWDSKCLRKNLFTRSRLVLCSSSITEDDGWLMHEVVHSHNHVCGFLCCAVYIACTRKPLM